MSLFALADLHLPFGDEGKTMHIFSGWDNYVERITDNWNYMVDEGDTVVVAGDISWALKTDAVVPDLRYIHEKLNGRKIILKGNHDLWWTTAAKTRQLIAEHGFDSISVIWNDAILAEDKIICGTRGWLNIDRDNAETDDVKIRAREAGRLALSLSAAKQLQAKMSDKADKADNADKSDTPDNADKSDKPDNEIIVFTHYPCVYGADGIGKNSENTEMLDVMRAYEIRRSYYGHLHGAQLNNAFGGERYGIKFQNCSADGTEFTPVRIK
ncbi:MAG: metallophosphoesterase [Oscillospiraceae bacterium]|jgi:predicted phosphohydrolase|nr:metallophosphoesterase [Oscillospiraceae bacterium]